MVGPLLRVGGVRRPAIVLELNPVERLLEELHRRIEGRVYDSLDAKQAAVEAYLQELAADLARVQRLCGWDWLLAALDHLPGEAISPASE